MKSKIILALFLSVLCTLESCLLIYSPGKSARLNIFSTPEDTKVTIDGRVERIAPVSIKLKKKKEHEFIFTNDGYLDEKVVLHPHHNDKLHTLAYLSWFYTGFTGVFDAFGSAYKLGFRDITVNMLKRPEKTTSKVAIGFSEITVTIDPGKKVGTHYIFKGRDINNNTFEKSLNWGDDAKFEASRLIQLSIDELPKYGYQIVQNTEKSAFSGEKNAKIMISGKIEDMTFRLYTSTNNSYSTVEYDINWTVKDSRGKELVKLSTKASAAKYNDGDRSVFLDAYRRALFDMVSSEEFSNLLYKFEEVEVANAAGKIDKSKTTYIGEVKERNFTSTESLMKEVSPSVVTVVTDEGHGSGFFISEDGLIVTNYHVVNGAKNVKVEFSSGFILAADVVKVAEDEDLAIIKIAGAGFKPLHINSGEEIDLGKDVYAIGTPADRSLGQSVTRGIISGKRKFNERVYIQSDVKVNWGNSGGPLIDKNGNVLGIVNAKISGDGVEGLGFAIPAYYIFKSLNISYN